MNGENYIPSQVVNFEEIINSFGMLLDEKMGGANNSLEENVNEKSENLAYDVKSVMIKYSLAHTSIMEYVKDGFIEIIDDAKKSVESQRKKFYDVLDYAKSEIEELKKTKLDPSEVQARVTKFRYFFDSSLSFIDYSFIEYDVKEFSKKFFNKFDISDFNVEREIQKQFNSFSDEIMDMYEVIMKDMQSDLTHEFSRTCDQLEIGLNQEQKITEALDHPEQLSDQDIIIYAQGKSQEELEASYRNAKQRIIEDPSLDEQKRNEQLKALDNIYSKVLENGIPIDYVYNGENPELNPVTGPKL